MAIIDKLHSLADTYIGNLIDMEDIQFALTEATLNMSKVANDGNQLN